MFRFKLRRVAVWFAFSCLLASCGLREPAPRNPNDLTIHEASRDPVPGWNALGFWDPSEGEIYVAPTAELTLDDIQSAERTRDESGRIAISINFTKAGSEKMRKFTSEHIGKQAAIVFMGKVTNAPLILSEIRSRAVISFGATGMPPEDAERILGSINRN